jgi:hypothetical protein
MVMNKSAVMGFLAGVLVLAAVVGLYGASKRQDKLPAPGHINATVTKDQVAASEESTEANNGLKSLEEKHPPVNVPTGQPVAKLEPKGRGLKMARSAAPGGYRAGQAFDISVSFEYEGPDKVTALALVERIPQGWSFQEVSSGAKPVIVPGKGAAGELTFVWVQVPAFPCTLSYRIVPGPDVTGPQEVQGQAVYRQLGPEQRTETLKSVVNSAAP